MDHAGAFPVESPNTLLSAAHRFKRHNILILFGGIPRNESGKLREALSSGAPLTPTSFPVAYDLAENKAHTVTGGDEPVHAIYDMRQACA